MARKSISYEEMISLMEEKFPNEKENIEVLEYSGLSKPFKCKCKKCNTIFEVKECRTLLNRHTNIYCVNCYNPLEERKQQKEYYERAIALFDKTPHLHLIETYQKQRGDRRRLAIRYYCDKCGEISEVFACDLKNDYYSCRHCDKGARMSKDDFANWLNKRYEGQYELIKDKCKDNITNADRVYIKCSCCNFIFTITVTSLKRIRGIKCPKCEKSKSKGELYIEKWLNKHNIDYITETHLSWLPSKLRYDFVIPKQKIIIEFDGQQHREYTEYFGTYEKFLHLQENDKIKNELAIENGYNLFRIPYQYHNHLNEILTLIIGSTTIPQGSRGKCLEINSSFLTNAATLTD